MRTVIVLIAFGFAAASEGNLRRAHAEGTFAYGTLPGSL